MKIGEFAKLSNATIRTLRYYDNLGLLKPDSIDQYTGYRIYSSAKLEQMRQIQAMKEIGFTLLEIKTFLALDQSDESVKVEFISAKRQEIEIEKQKTELRLTALDELIDKLKDGGDKMDDIKYYVPYSDDYGLMERNRHHSDENSRAYSNMKTSPKFVKVAAYGSGLGAVDENGIPYVWGGERIIMDGLPPVIDFDIGYTHTVAIDADGKLYGWGANKIEAIDFPDDLPRMISVKAGHLKTVAISEDGLIHWWGGALGQSQREIPSTMGTVKQIAIGPYNTAALDSYGKVFVWGIFAGALKGNESRVPVTDVEISMIALTEYCIACLGVDGKVYGDVKHIELNSKFKPKPEMTNIKKIVAGRESFAAIDGDGKLYIWGEYSQLPGGNSIMSIPLNLPPIIDAAFGDHEIICVGEDGKLYGWGVNEVVVPPVFDGFKNGAIFPSEEIIDTAISCDVYTIEQLYEAVQDRMKNITIKADMTVEGQEFYVINGITLTVAENVTLTIDCTNCHVEKKLINNGTITGTGQLVVHSPIEGTGNIINNAKPNILGFLKGLKVILIGTKVNELAKYLAEDSFYTAVNYHNSEATVITIDTDLVIPKGKELWLNQQCTLKLNAGVTLTIEGTVVTYTAPIIEGIVIGEITDNSNKERDVYTFDELYEVTHQVMKPGIAYRSYHKVIIKNDMICTSKLFSISSYTALVIDEGVTLTVNSINFTVLGEFINNGTINGSGHIYVDSPISGTGNIDISNGLRIDVYDANVNELDKYLSDDSIYTSLIYTNPRSGYFKSMYLLNPETSFITINNDLIIPKGKSVWLNKNCILRVKEGVTLKVDGELKTFDQPIINGTLIGEITIIDVDKPRDVYTFDELYVAIRDKINDITVKDNITVTFPREYIPINTLIIDEGVTLTIDSCPINILKNLINNGTINGIGTITIMERITSEGCIDLSDGLEISKTGLTDINEVGMYLNSDSIYTHAAITPREETTITIDNDLVIPKGKSLFLNRYCTLHISDGVTLTIDGKLETYNNPIIDGSVIGEITQLDIIL